MADNRYIIVNTETGIADGLYLNRVLAEKSAALLREAWAGFEWIVEETNETYPLPGRVCLGHACASRLLKKAKDKLENH